MVVKSEIYPIVLKIKPDSSLDLSSSEISINLEESKIQIYNDRGGEITNPSDQDKLFVDNSNLIIGYLWDTGTSSDLNSRFNVQDYYLFRFLVAINYKIDDNTTKIFKLSFSTNKLLEANDVIGGNS